MRRINHRFSALVILFCVYTATGYSQNISASCEVFVTATLWQTATPQSMCPHKFVRALDSIIALLERKDGKMLTIAAQTSKKATLNFTEYFIQPDLYS